MTAILARADDILRRRAWTTELDRPWTAMARCAAVMILFAVVYGVVIGTFGGLSPDRMLQMLYSAIKVPLLLTLTFAISLPSFFVLNTLFGLRGDFGYVVRALIATQAGLAIILASLSPLTATWYLSSADYRQAIVANGVIFAVASLSAQALLRGYYRPLVARNRRHRWVLWLWVGVYALIGIQMAWILRPFVGSPGAPVRFFREEAWDNAYVIVGRLVWDVLSQ